MADNNSNDSVRLHPSSQENHSPVAPSHHVKSHTLAPIVPRSPSLHAGHTSLTSPPLSPRLPGNHSRSPSISSAINVVDLLALQQINGSNAVARDWKKIPLSELVQGQKLVFVDGDTPVEEACQVIPLFLLMQWTNNRRLLIKT